MKAVVMNTSDENAGYPNVCLIDDDLISHLHLANLLHKIDPTAKLISFVDADMALSYLEDQIDARNFPEVIFLNIYMPSLKDKAWEVVDRLRGLQEEGAGYPTLKKARMYFVTADELEGDRERAGGYELVRDFWIKPVVEEKLRKALLSNG